MGNLNYTTARVNELLKKANDMPDSVTDGKTPVLETGTTTTLSPTESATSEVVRSGEDSNGNPRYKINLGIPKGQDGAGGSGGGTAGSVDWSDVRNKPSWVNSTTKPTYAASEVGALPSDTTIPSKTSQLTNDSKFVKETGLKTVNGQSLVGSGNITISGGSGGGSGNVSVTNAGSLVKGRLYAFNPSANGSAEGVFSTIPDASSSGAGLMGSDLYDKLSKYKETIAFPITVLSLTVASTSDDILTAFGLDPVNDNATLAYFMASLADVQSGDYTEDTPKVFIGNHECGIYASQDSTTYTLDLSYIDQGGVLKTVKVTGKGGSDSVVTYSVGFSDSGDDTYYLPPAVLNLTDDSTKSDMETAFGGVGKLDELFSALKDGQGVCIYDSSGTSPVLYPVSVKWYKMASILSYLHLVFNQCFKAMNEDYVVTKSIYIKPLLSSGTCRVKTIYLDGYPIKDGIYSLSDSSTSADISTAIGGESGLRGIIAALKDRNRLVLRAAASGAIGLSGMYTEEANGDIQLILSGIGYGLWGGMGGMCSVSYTKSTSEFSVAIVGVTFG